MTTTTTESIGFTRSKQQPGLLSNKNERTYIYICPARTLHVLLRAPPPLFIKQLIRPLHLTKFCSLRLAKFLVVLHLAKKWSLHLLATQLFTTPGKKTFARAGEKKAILGKNLFATPGKNLFATPGKSLFDNRRPC